MAAFLRDKARNYLFQMDGLLCVTVTLSCSLT